MSESSPAPILQTTAKQVIPLGLNGSGSTTDMGKSLEKQNKELTMQIAQSAADDVYDAKVPPRVTPQKYVIEPFAGTTRVAYSIGVVGVLLIVYGLVVG